MIVRKGSRIGSLKVLGVAASRHSGNSLMAYSWVQCDCGRKFEVRNSQLRNGQHTCRRCSRRLSAGMGRVNALLAGYKYAAEKRNLLWRISVKQFKRLVSSDCFYCGAAPRVMSTSAYRAGGNAVLLNGIDRKDSAKGYLTQNVVPCCTTCNRMKWSLSTKEFFDQIRKIIQKRGELHWLS